MTNLPQHRGSNFWIRRTAGAVMMLATVIVSITVTRQSAQAQTFTVLYAFKGSSDGANPTAGLIQDASGNLYGTTSQGGHSFSGTVFKLDPAARKEKVLYAFAGFPDGAYPSADLIRDRAGNLYGTTAIGGTSQYGTVFKLSKGGKETVLYNFKGAADGGNPYAGLVLDKVGNLYGTTQVGGAHQYGTVFKLDQTGKENVLHSFAYLKDGGYPSADLLRDEAGDLFGTTTYGGICCGTVFEFPASGGETLLHGFSGGRDGNDPVSGLVRDVEGSLFGTTLSGGRYGFGMVLKLSKTGKETVLYNFRGGADGANPMGGVTRDVAGNLYGTTFVGGNSGNGTIFKIDNTGKETVLHSFEFLKDGAFPSGSLLQDANGNLYGTTQDGGAHGSGTVFKLTP
jgi:uncharacterized repeat protein (TIGR03803 family)